MSTGTEAEDRDAPPSTLVARLRDAGCVFAEDEARLLVAEAGSAAELQDMVSRRAGGLPLEQVLGWVAFGGIRLVVEPGVFVPRVRTELLAAHALRLARAAAARSGRPPVLVELCCGAAPVAAVVARAAERDGAERNGAGPVGVELHAADLDPAAVACARRNLGDRGRVWEGDIYAALPDELRGRVDVLVANAPYVPADAVALMPPEAREHEPTHALSGGADGLAVLRAVVAGAPDWLAPGGGPAVECSVDQAVAVAGLLRRAGFDPLIAHDPARDATAVIGEGSRD